MQLLVCFALKEEAAPFRKFAANRPALSLLIVGIGRENAEKSVRQYLSTHPTPPDLVLTCGFAGGLNPALKIGDVLYDWPHSSKPDPELIARLTTAGVGSAKFVCTDRIAITVAEKNKLRVETEADVVEMESAAIHAVCQEHRIPCVTVRAISDTAHEDLPLDFNALAKPDKSIDFGKLALAIAKSPGKISALMQLQKKTNLAAHRLAAALEKFISP
jgi:adenosylhomocysteine nucleosidase